MKGNTKLAILIMDDEKKERIKNYADETIDFILKKTKDKIEIAYLLKMLVEVKMLVEGHQDTEKVTIPIDIQSDK